MFEVTVEAGFSSGHYLRNYRGKCENPHGHNYKVFITLQGKDLDEAGLLLDFKLLKQVMRPVVDYLDRYVYAPAGFVDYLDLFGGDRLLRQQRYAKELT